MHTKWSGLLFCHIGFSANKLKCITKNFFTSLLAPFLWLLIIHANAQLCMKIKAETWKDKHADPQMCTKTYCVTYDILKFSARHQHFKVQKTLRARAASPDLLSRLLENQYKIRNNISSRNCHFHSSSITFKDFTPTLSAIIWILCKVFACEVLKKLKLKHKRNLIMSFTIIS